MLGELLRNIRLKCNSIWTITVYWTYVCAVLVIQHRMESRTCDACVPSQYWEKCWFLLHSSPRTRGGKNETNDYHNGDQRYTTRMTVFRSPSIQFQFIKNVQMCAVTMRIILPLIFAAFANKYDFFCKKTRFSEKKTDSNIWWTYGSGNWVAKDINWTLSADFFLFNNAYFSIIASIVVGLLSEWLTCNELFLWMCLSGE